METVHYLNEELILTFLVQVLIVLSLAKVFGSICMRFGYPAIAGEILTGILLGPTVLGRLQPELQSTVFPSSIVQQTMLETVSWFGVLFLLLITGFEVSVSSAVRRGKAALSVGVFGVLVPFLFGCSVFWWLPEHNFGANADRLTFTLFLSTAASISALAIIARVLHDLQILKSDLGVTILSGYVINDLLGWMIFSAVLGLTATQSHDVGQTAQTVLTIVLFATFCLTIGSKAVGAITQMIKRSFLPHPATILTFVTCLALLCGAITQWLGIHAILGFFLAGVMAGNTPKISDRTREIISQMVHAVFVPIFFASIGLKVDFVKNFQPEIVALFASVAIVGKLCGAYVGARLASVPRGEALSIGIAFIPGGAMEIILGLLALEFDLIGKSVFVAIVFAALLSSVMVGPLLSWRIQRASKRNGIGRYLAKDAIVPSLKAHDRWTAIAEMSHHASQVIKTLDSKTIEQAVRSREEIMGTGLERGLAVPHGRLDQLERPFIAFGRSALGIDWDARDGLATHIVFLILTPPRDEGVQLQILAAIAKCMLAPEMQSQMAVIDNPHRLYDFIFTELNKASS